MEREERENVEVPGESPPSRRGFLSGTASAAMAGGLVAGYGSLGAMAGRFLFPAHGEPRGWVVVDGAARLAREGSLTFLLPGGKPVAITRIGNAGDASDFLALSSTCPHLGCQVHWEPQNNRYFCPCHNGVFDPTGKATAGPPAEAGQSLPRYPLKMEKGLLFIEIPLQELGGARGGAA